MNGKLLLFTFILLIPALSVLGHDLYMAYGADEEKIEKLKDLEFDHGVFHLSDIGRLWIAYAPDSLNDVRRSVSLSTWQNFVAPLMEQTALLVALVPVILMYFLVAIFWLLRIGPYAGVKNMKTKAGNDFSVYDKHEKKGKVKYGRK
ncbi:MAG: hypothetical protein AAF569_07330 [Pseudomonadota bacterium]